MRALVDPFIGTAATDLPEPTGLAATWWWPKAQIGNTHPGACHPFGMVSACAYSGAYPTGYGVYDLNTEGVPTRLDDALAVSGFTHFQQSGTGRIRTYYNYMRLTPMVEPLSALGRRWAVHDEEASPGRYAATLSSGVRAELTVGPRSAVHRYTFPDACDARVVLDLTVGGLLTGHSRTIPSRASVQLLGPGRAQATCMLEGVPVSVHLEIDAPRWRDLLWYDRRVVESGRYMTFDHIRETTLRPFGVVSSGPVESGTTVEVRLGFSLRGPERAAANLHDDCGAGPRCFDDRLAVTERAWDDHLDRITVEGGTPEQRTIFATAQYHAMLKPSFAAGESPFWSQDGPWAFDVSTLWDLYKTQLPLLALIAPDRAVELVQVLLTVCEEEGNLPIGYRMARGADRFDLQGSALAHTFIADVAALGIGQIDWEWALVQMLADLRRGAIGEEFALRGAAHPISHTLDLAQGYACTAQIARMLDDEVLATHLEEHAERWRDAFDARTGLLVDSSYYEGGRWNYSFRLLPDMAGRVELAGGEERFVALLDRFFGYGAPPVTQPGTEPGADELAAGEALHRFEGLNNEPDMEAPWAYHWAGRPDRTAEIVHAALTNQFATGRGGLPGNDDSGGLSSWVVWASLGLFPVAGQHTVLLHPPAFPHARVDLGDHVLEIDATGLAPPERGGPVSHVQRVCLDGRELRETHLDSRRLRTARRLQVELGPRPSGWGRPARPPSSSRPAAARR